MPIEIRLTGMEARVYDALEAHKGCNYLELAHNSGLDENEVLAALKWLNHYGLLETAQETHEMAHKLIGLAKTPRASVSSEPSPEME